MRKITFVTGVGAGFVLGSRCGRAPYELLAANVRWLRRRRQVQVVADRVRSAAGDRLHAADRALRARVPGRDVERPEAAKASRSDGLADSPGGGSTVSSLREGAFSDRQRW
jgi:hypothetical protein